MDKICARCKETKTLDKFSRKRGEQRYAYCKSCEKIYKHEWYEKNKEKIAQTTKKYRKLTHEKHKSLIRDIKDSAVCADCGEKFPFICLDFDHLPEYEKYFNISRFCYERPGTTRLLDEIAKCEIVCACCHRIRTWNRKNPEQSIANHKMNDV